MKFVFFISLFILSFFFTTLSQTYHPLPYSNATWREVAFPDLSNDPDYYYVNEYYIDGDSLIEGYIYQRVRFFSIAPGDTAISNDLYFYRQDTLAKKVYGRNIYYPFNDTLLYDFSLQEGDTLFDMLFFPPSTSTDYFIWVDKIDSILTPIGYLKRFRLLSTISLWGYGYWRRNW